jgi:1-acyl-sn-glycerol-3-phosphate acyltransferase
MGRLLFLLAAWPVRIFYRRWRLGGEVPREGPLLLVSNHPNGLVDPVVVADLAGRPVRFLAKAPLFRLPVLGRLVRAMGSLPVHRPQDRADTSLNQATFDAAAAALLEGDAVCLFPEGTSHSEPHLQRLKTGAARLALSAESRCGFALGLRILPVGLVHDAKTRFRSKLATWVGTAITLSDLAELHERDERAAAAALTERIAAGLAGVTLNLERWEDLAWIELADELRPGVPGRRVERLRDLAQGLGEARRRDPERLAELSQRAADFALLLRRLGLRASELEDARPPGSTPPRARRSLAAAALEAAACGPVALLGWILFLPPYAGVLALDRILGLSPELRATGKILASSLLYPAWLALAAILCALRLGLLAGAAALAALPLLGWLAILASERLLALRRDARVVLRLTGRGSLGRRLAGRRDELAAQVEALAQERENSAAAPRDDWPPF